MEQELKACPFCGGDAALGRGRDGCFVNCTDCCASTNVITAPGMDEREAITAWNTRHPTPAADEVEAVAWAIIRAAKEDDAVRELQEYGNAGPFARAAIAAMQARSAEHEANLYSRDRFIVGKGLWDDFVSQLPDRPAEPASNPCKLPAEPAGEEPVAWPEKWSGDMTVGNMIANLRTIPPETPMYSAYHISREGRDSLLRVKRPTISWERVDGLTIKTGDESVPYSCVVWSHPQRPEQATPTNPERLVEALISRATPEWSCHEDNDRAPREFWHVRHNLGELSTDWMKWGRQEPAELSPEDQAAGEAASLDYLRRSLTALSAAPLKER